MINHAVSFNTPIIHVAVAVADTDETYGAYAAAEDDTFDNTRNNDNHANHRNDDDDEEKNNKRRNLGPSPGCSGLPSGQKVSE